MKIVFCMKININVFYKLVVSFLLFKTRNAQSTQNDKFVISLYYLQKGMREPLKYLKYIVIALLLYWRSIHLTAINFQLLNLAIWFDIWKRLGVAHAVFGRFVSHIQYLHFTSVLSWILYPLWIYLIRDQISPTWWVFVWWWENETDFGENEGAYRKRSLSKVSGKSNFIQFELQNKQSPLRVYKLQWPQNT